MNEEQKLVALIGLSNKATLIQIVPKSLKEVKVKGPMPQDNITTLSTDQPFENLKGSATTFHSKNMIPIPDLLLKTFITFNQTDSKSVAQVFYEAMLNADNDCINNANNDMYDTDTEADDDDQSNDKEKTPVTSSKAPAKKKTEETQTSFLSPFYHVLQFCYLGTTEKISPLLFTVSTDNETLCWFEQLEQTYISMIPSTIHNSHADTSTYDNEETTDSHQTLCESKDTRIVHTLLKISETLDQNSLQATAETEKKEPGFKKLEPHCRQ